MVEQTVLDNINYYLQNRDFAKAEKLSKNILENSPNAVVYNTLGLGLAMQQKYKDAISAFLQAIKIQPTEGAFHNNLGNAYKKYHDLDNARKHYQQALRFSPNSAEAYNNLGTINYMQGLLTVAIELFKKSLRLDPVYSDAHYNIANAYLKLEQFEAAITHYKQVLQLNPSNLIASFNIAMAYIAVHKADSAIKYLKKFLEHEPNNVQALEQLATALLEIGNSLEASQAFKKLVAIKNDSFLAHHNLAVLYLKNNEAAKACQHFKIANKIDPTNDTASHMYLALSRAANITTAPQKFIIELFDQYADTYDIHMKKTLNYKVPALLRNAVSKTYHKNSTYNKVLDLGCGTGQCGVLFQDFSHFLVGVDLSNSMLQIAKKLQAYDALCIYDIQQILPKPKDSLYNLIIAGDVLVYIGDLAKIFANCSLVLEKNGQFAFSVEDSEVANYSLEATGRFTHNYDYILKCGSVNNLKLLYSEEITPRIHNNLPIKGRIYIFEKV